jgi:hypothetical protein
VAINPSSTRELDIDTIIRLAYQSAGLANAGETTTAPGFSAKRAMAADFLDVLMKSMQAGAVIARHVVLETVNVVALTSSYALSSSTLSLDGDAMFKEAGEDVETVVKPMDLESYQAISDKLSDGPPSRYYHQRTATQALILWPVPDQSGTLTVQAHKLVADANVVSYTPDLERHWLDWLTLALAHKLAMASSLPIADKAYLRDQAKEALKTAKQYSQSHVSFSFVLDHRTGWTR